MLKLMPEEMVKIPAKPYSVNVDLPKTAIIVVDMQKAFVSKGGMWDMRGLDLTKVNRVIKPIKEVLEVARLKKLKVVFIRHAYRHDLSNAGDTESPNYWKEPNFLILRKNPSYKEKGPVEGMWGSDIIDEIKPLKSDIIISKPRYSGFVGTELDTLLRSLKIKYLFFMGVATNICVESTVRDAFHKEYWPILISDCCMAIGPNYMQKATIWNIKRAFGWVTNSDKFIHTLKNRS
jgi:ureidoacrylate peracid hydrolase